MAKKKLAPRNTVAAADAVADAVHETTTKRKLDASTKSLNKRFNALLPVRLYNRMKKYSDETGISMKAQFVEAISRYLEERNY